MSAPPTLDPGPEAGFVRPGARPGAGPERALASPRIAVACGLLACLPGLWMRLAALDWMDFGGDEVTILARAYRARAELSLHGMPSSIGVPLPNFLSYLLALPVGWTRDPVAIARGIALLNLAGVAGIFFLLRRPFGVFPALCATALFASAPWPVLLARKVWNPDFLFPFAMALYLLLASQLAAPRRWKCAAAVVAYVLWCGFHASTWAVAPPLVLWVLWFRIPVDRRGIALGVGVGLVLLAPWFAHFWTTGGDDLAIARATRASAAAEVTEGFLPALARHVHDAVGLSAGALFDELGAEAPSTSRASALVARGWIAWGTLALCAALARTVVLCVRARRGAPLGAVDRGFALAGLVCATILCAYAATGMPMRSHFYAVLLPWPTIFAAWWTLRVFGGAGLGVVTALVVAAHATLFASFLDDLRAGTVGREPYYPTPFARNVEGWRAEVEQAFWRVDVGHELEREEQRLLGEAFAVSPVLLLSYDGARDEPPAGRRGAVEIAPVAEGLEVRGSVAGNLVSLPAFTPVAGRRTLLRLELDSPRETEGTLFYGTAERPESGPGLALAFRVPRGASTIHLVLPATANGRTFLRVVTGRFVLRSAEARAAGS